MILEILTLFAWFKSRVYKPIYLPIYLDIYRYSELDVLERFEQNQPQNHKLKTLGQMRPVDMATFSTYVDPSSDWAYVKSTIQTSKFSIDTEDSILYIHIDIYIYMFIYLDT